MRSWLGLASALVIFGAACGDDEVPPDAASTTIDAVVNTPDATGPTIDAALPDAIVFDADPNAPDAAPPPDAMLTCTMNGFTVGSNPSVTYRYEPETSNDGGVIPEKDEIAWLSDSALPIMKIELFYHLGANPNPHTFAFNNENYDSCHTCAQMIAGGKQYLVIYGNLNVTENGSVTGGDAGATGNFAGSLTDAVAIEVTFTGSVSTPVPGGDVWCIANMPFSTAF